MKKSIELKMDSCESATANYTDRVLQAWEKTRAEYESGETQSGTMDEFLNAMEKE